MSTHETSKPGYLPPLIICGMPRSGTDFHADMIGHHPSAAISTEINNDVIKSAYELYQTLDIYTRKRPKRRHMLEHFDITVFGLWITTSFTPKNPADIIQRVYSETLLYGNKTPESEKYFEFYHQVFNPKPKFLYCLRNGFDMIESRLNMTWRKLPLSNIVSRYKNSVSKAEAILKDHPENILISQVDRVGESLEERTQFAQKIFSFAGLEVEEEIKQFILSWNVRNSRDKVKNQPEKKLLSPRQRKKLEKDKGFMAIQERYGYL